MWYPVLVTVMFLTPTGQVGTEEINMGDVSGARTKVLCEYAATWAGAAAFMSASKAPLAIEVVCERREAV